MLNLVFVAQPEDLQAAFARAGWVETDKWTPIFVWHLLRHRTNDAALPMARFYLFGRVQDYSYALPDPSAVVSRRHHLRIWKTGSTLNGTPVWAGAATHDVAIVIAKHGRLINHRIDPAVDAERDFVGSDLTDSSSVSRQEYLYGPDPVFQAQTASGESYHSDSRILLLDLHKGSTVITAVPPQASAQARSSTLTVPMQAILPRLVWARFVSSLPPGLRREREHIWMPPVRPEQATMRSFFIPFHNALAALLSSGS